MKSPENPPPVRPDTHAAALRAPGSPVRDIFIRLMQLAPSPLDCAGLLAFCVGAAALIECALGLLKQPTPPALQLQSQCQALAKACIERFETCGAADAYKPMANYKSSYPAWAAIAAAGEAEALGTHPAAAALGTELSMCLDKSKKMAIAFARDAPLVLADDEWQGVSLYEAIEFDGEGKQPAWLTHAKGALVDFRGVFEQAPPDPPSPKTFEERAANELRNRAAYASYRRRAGILDSTCLSRTQIAESIAYGSPAPFATLAAHRPLRFFAPSRPDASIGPSRENLGAASGPPESHRTAISRRSCKQQKRGARLPPNAPQLWDRSLSPSRTQPASACAQRPPGRPAPPSRRRCPCRPRASRR